MSPFQDLNALPAQSNPVGPTSPLQHAESDSQPLYTTNAQLALGAIGEQARQVSQDGSDSLNTAGSRMSLSERNARQYEELLALQRRVQAQISMIDPETRREVDEVQALEDDITRYRSAEYNETPISTNERQQRPFSGTASQMSNVKRYSLSTMPSSSNVYTSSRRPSRSGSQVASPYGEQRGANTAMSQALNGQLPPNSVPGSDRNSDTDVHDEEDRGQETPNFRPKAGANPNRNSMPVTAFDLRNQPYGVPTPPSSLAFFNNRTFAQVDKDKDPTRSPLRTSQHGPTSPDSSKTFLQLHQTDDKFPILVRRETDKGPQFPTVANLSDRSRNQASPELQSLTDPATATRHRQSLPPNTVRQPIMGLGDPMLGPNSQFSDANISKNPAANRRSVEIKFTGFGEGKQAMSSQPPMPDREVTAYPEILSSYSTNDVPTLKTSRITSPPHQVEQPNTGPSALNGAHVPTGYSLDKASITSPIGQNARPDSNTNIGQSLISPQMQSYNYGEYGLPNSTLHTPVGPNIQSPMYGAAYGLPLLTNGFNALSIGGQGSAWPTQPAMYPGTSTGLGQFPNQQASRGAESTARSSGQRRGQGGDDSRYATIAIEALAGEIYGLCKDQHGCRFLQKKLEERNPAHLELIFKETNPHVVELMTDPFGNYLCQKLLEHANQEQRTTMIRCASPQMVKIALNQHGTRALQKMIESVETDEQIALIVEGLRNKVIQLIQDLNGNHVIQKCLNVLERNNAQFIYDAVCTHVVTVGTHRHGCCVLQRCIDHASGLQKGQIVAAVTQSAFTLVQDPFGNYVVQYILDLGEPTFSAPLCASFLGNICVLSRQKFSSNVIEKAIRIADVNTRRAMIEEMLVPHDMEKMLRDSFANYVIQTAIEYADSSSKEHLLALIRPLLPSIRNTPHGRRIQSKIAEHEGRRTGGPPGPMPLGDMGSPVQMPFTGHQNFSRPTLGYNGNAGLHNASMQHVNGMHGPAFGNGAGVSGQQRKYNEPAQLQPPIGYNVFSQGARMSYNNAMGQY